MRRVSTRWTSDTAASALMALSSADGAVAEVPKFAEADEKRAWSLIEDVELQLRARVLAAARTKWGDHAERSIVGLLGENQRTALEGLRTKHKAAYPLSTEKPATTLLDYFYLGQLVEVMLTNDLWGEFKAIFREKDALQRLVAPVSKVRNDRAHFRAVPDKELQRCIIACDDLLTHLRATGGEG